MTLKVHSKVMISNQNWKVLRDSAYTSGQAPTTICRDYTSDNGERTQYIPKLFAWSLLSSRRVGISVESVATSGKATTTILAIHSINNQLKEHS